MTDRIYTNAGEPNSKMSEIIEKNQDSDSDSWDSGANQPDYYDHTIYEQNDPSDDNSLTDEGDENNLGDMSDEEYRAQNAGLDLGMGGNPHTNDQLDDLYYKDHSFDCD